MTPSELTDLHHLLKQIQALCENPHWTSERRWRIAALVTAALRLLENR